MFLNCTNFKLAILHYPFLPTVKKDQRVTSGSVSKPITKVKSN